VTERTAAELAGDYDHSIAEAIAGADACVSGDQLIALRGKERSFDGFQFEQGIESGIGAAGMTGEEAAALTSPARRLA